MGFYEENFEIIKKDFGNIDIKKITVPMLQMEINKYISTPRKCKSICQCISSLYSYAERLCLIEKNIYKRVNVPKYTPNETPHYDITNFKKLLNILRIDNEPIFTPILLLGCLGLRPSEALALKESDIVNNILYITKAVVSVQRKGEKHKEIEGETKTDKSKRAIPLNTDFIKLLNEYKINNNVKSDFLCILKTGQKITESTLSKHLNRIINKYNFPHITPYGFRHTFGQMQKAQGTDIYTISRLMGHSNIQTTTKTYFHDDNLLNKVAISKTLNILSE